jgi:hypothetical protein
MQMRGLLARPMKSGGGHGGNRAAALGGLDGIVRVDENAARHPPQLRLAEAGSVTN